MTFALLRLSASRTVLEPPLLIALRFVQRTAELFHGAREIEICTCGFGCSKTRPAPMNQIRSKKDSVLDRQLRIAISFFLLTALQAGRYPLSILVNRYANPERSGIRHLLVLLAFHHQEQRATL